MLLRVALEEGEEEAEAVAGLDDDVALLEARDRRRRLGVVDADVDRVGPDREPREVLASARAGMLAARSKRVPPATDRKHVAAWNGYVISGLARAATVLQDPSVLEDASRSADFVLDSMIDNEGRLQRVHNEGRTHGAGFLDDHAGMLTACLDLQRAGAGDRYLRSARSLANEILERFADSSSGALYLAPVESDGLIHRPRSDRDGATPDAAALALLGLVRLASISGDRAIDDFVENALTEPALEMEQAPHAFPTLLRAVALRTRGSSVAVIVGDSDDPRTIALADRARRVLRPEDAVLVSEPNAAPPDEVAAEWLLGREPVGGRPTAYLCRGSTCSLPVHEPAELVADLLSQT